MAHTRRTHVTHMRPWTSVDPAIFPLASSLLSEYSQGGDGRVGEGIETSFVDLDTSERDVDGMRGVEATASVDDERWSG